MNKEKTDRGGTMDEGRDMSERGEGAEDKGRRRIEEEKRNTRWGGLEDWRSERRRKTQEKRARREVAAASCGQLSATNATCIIAFHPVFDWVILLVRRLGVHVRIDGRLLDQLRHCDKCMSHV